LAGLKSRSAAVEVCYPFDWERRRGRQRPTSIQNDSGLTQGLAGRSVAG
jgi:hypothetical protein